MGNFYAGSKTSVHSCILTALGRSSACTKHTQITAKTTSWSRHEEPTRIIAHLTFIRLYRQRDFRVVSQRKPLPFSHELSVNKSSIGTVVFDVGNIGILRTHFLKEKKTKGKITVGENDFTVKLLLLAQEIRLPRLFHKPCNGALPRVSLKESALKVLKPWFL